MVVPVVSATHNISCTITEIVHNYHRGAFTYAMLIRGIKSPQGKVFEEDNFGQSARESMTLALEMKVFQIFNILSLNAIWYVV